MIISIDPGPVTSGFVVLDPTSRVLPVVLTIAAAKNGDIVDALEWSAPRAIPLPLGAKFLVIEMIASYGMPVGAEIFETCVWIGRFLQAWRGPSDRLTRVAVKSHLCHSAKAKDPNVRQALIDRLGKPGTKRNRGPTYGVTGDAWQALAVAVTWADRRASVGASATP